MSAVRTLKVCLFEIRWRGVVGVVADGDAAEARVGDDAGWSEGSGSAVDARPGGWRVRW